MNYYRRYSGDYLRKTARLSLTEHGAYSVMLDYCYTSEEPLPADKDEIYLMVRALRPEDRKAVDKVLGLYFTLEADGYHQTRVDEEVEIARKVIDAAKENGKLGGRPKKPKNNPPGNPDNNQEETQRITQSVTETVTQNEPRNNHPPTTNHQPPTASLLSGQPPNNSNSAAPPLAENELQPTPAGVYAKHLRKLGVTVTSANPTLLAWIAEGFTLERCVDAVDRARMNGKPAGTNIPANYLDRIIRDDAAPKHEPMPRTDDEWVAAGKRLDVKAKPGELMPAFITRVRDAIMRGRHA